MPFSALYFVQASPRKCFRWANWKWQRLFTEN